MNHLIRNVHIGTMELINLDIGLDTNLGSESIQQDVLDRGDTFNEASDLIECVSEGI